MATAIQTATTGPTFLVDGVSALGVHNGVARVQFMKLNVDGKPETALELAVPVPQLKAIVEAFTKALRS